MTITVAGTADLTQRFDDDGLASLGLASPLLSDVWADAVPTANEAQLTFQVPALWYAPVAGVMSEVADGHALGLSALDGAPAVPSGAACCIFRLHPQARLRLEREMVAALESGGDADQSVRPVPALFLIEGGNQVPTPMRLDAGEKFLVGGTVSCYDEHGLIVDPFAFAAAVAGILAQRPALAVSPSAAAAGTVAAVAGSVTAGRFVQLVDLHGRPWVDPPVTAGPPGVSLFDASANEGEHLGDGALHAWPDGSTVAGRGDPTGADTDPALPRFGFATLGRMSTSPLAIPPVGAAGALARDTLRVAVADPPFHLLGNRSAQARAGVGAADQATVDAEAPAVRDGSPASLLPDGRSCLGFFHQEILGLQGGNPATPFTTGPLIASSVAIDGAGWPLPIAPGPTGAWPVSPAATAVTGSVADVLDAASSLRTGLAAAWIAGSNDLLVTLPSGLPAGLAVRLYPIQVLLGVSPGTQPLLRRADGDGTIVTGGTDTLVLPDPFRLGPTPVRGGDALLRADAVITWLPAEGPARVKIVANLSCDVDPDVARPAAGPDNLLASGLFTSQASAPLLGSLPRGSFTGLSAIAADPVAFLQDVVNQLASDQLPREPPRLPTMNRTESLLAVQLPQAVGADRYRGVLTGGWLTREIDSPAPRLGNPGAEGASEVHAPGVAATGQLGFDLWLAALHRALPVVPTASVATPLANGPLAGLATTWAMVQANAGSVPPDSPQTSSVSGAVLQTVPPFVETPELALIPEGSVNDVESFLTSTLPNFLTMPNLPEITRQVMREVRTCRKGRRDAQWALRRALRQARELVYLETPLMSPTRDPDGEAVAAAAVDLWAELEARLVEEPRLRVVVMVPREAPFAPAYEPWSQYFYEARKALAQRLATSGGTLPAPGGERPRVVIAHPMGVPGRPLKIRTTTVVVDDVWVATGTSTLSRRGMTFDGANDVVMTDWQLDRGVSVSIREHRRALMAAHLGTGPGSAGTAGGAPPSDVGAPEAVYTRLRTGVGAHAVFADLLASGGGGKLLPLWDGPDTTVPGAVKPHPAGLADPDGGAGASFVTAIAGFIGSGEV